MYLIHCLTPSDQLPVLIIFASICQAIIQYSHLIFKRNFPEKLTAPWFRNSQREQQHWNIQSKDDWTGIEEPQNCSIYQPMSIFFIQLYLIRLYLIDILPKWFLFLDSFWHGATGLQHRYRRDVKLLHLKGHLHFDLCLGEVTTNDLCYITKVLPNANGEGCRNLGGTLHMGITGDPNPQWTTIIRMVSPSLFGRIAN